MGFIDTLRSLLGLSTDERGGDGTVTVEHDPAAPAVDGDDDPDATAPPSTVPEAAAGTDAAASTESMVDETVDDPEAAAEPPEATPPTDPPVDPEAGGAVASDAGVDVDETESDGEPVADETGDRDADADGEPVADETSDRDADADGSESVETVSGIGPAYGTRLSEAGVETVADLAAADPADLAERISVAESRVGRWVARARTRADE